MIDRKEFEEILTENIPTWAIPKSQYEARLKADLEAILDEIDLKLAEQQADFIGADDYNESYGVQVSRNVIREKINALKEKKNENK